jgi:hypothetical protein
LANCPTNAARPAHDDGTVLPQAARPPRVRSFGGNEGCATPIICPKYDNRFNKRSIVSIIERGCQLRLALAIMTF